MSLFFPPPGYKVVPNRVFAVGLEKGKLIVCCHKTETREKVSKVPLTNSNVDEMVWRRERKYQNQEKVKIHTWSKCARKAKSKSEDFGQIQNHRQGEKESKPKIKLKSSHLNEEQKKSKLKKQK